MRRTSLWLLVSLFSAPLARADGMLDPGFGDGGLVTTNFSMFGLDTASSVVVLPDGRAVVAGSTSPNLAQAFIAAARYLPTGALDPSFDGDGIVTVPFGMAPDMSSGVDEVLLQPDGRIGACARSVRTCTTTPSRSASRTRSADA